jgi:hypothetical protein
MGMLFIKCPKTAKPVATGIAMDKKSFESSTLSQNSTSCPHCNGTHVWNKADVLPLTD